LRKDEPTLPAQFNGQNLSYLYISYWHAAIAVNYLIMKLHKAIMVPA
jgi:hypothetical protein